MAQRMFHETGQDGRSVLGMLEVQVERDPKTGATVVRSVAPVSAPAGAPNAATVFDDGRKSIHAVGRSAGQPSTEELGQILNAIDGVGMKVLLDEVTVTPTEADVKTEDGGIGEAFDRTALPLASHHTASKEDNTRYDRFGHDQVEAEEKRATTLVRDIAEQVDHIEEARLEEGPVTLMFLGYTDATSAADDAGEDQGGVIPVERVIITEDGEELLVEPQTPVALEQGAGKERRGFQDVPLEANGGGGGGGGGGGEASGDEGDKAPQSSTPPCKAEEDGKAKRKTCKCCSVM